jgi:hypothetical protein
VVPTGAVVQEQPMGRLRPGWWCGCDGSGWTCSGGSARHLTGPLPAAAGEWAQVRLRFAAVKAARTLLSFGANVEVISPPEVRVHLAAVAAEIADLYSNVRLG